MKFVKRPLVVEAEQWFEGNAMPGVFPPTPFDYGPYVMSSYGTPVFLKDGDWVIAEPDGVHFHVCPPHVFEANYEKVES